MTKTPENKPELVEDETELDEASGGLKINMSDVMITSYQTGGSAGSDTVPTESLSLNYEKIKPTYKR